MKKLSILFILAVTFYSCESNRKKVDVSEYEEINNRVRIYNINKSGMDYIILRSYEGGVHIQNLTLDSLQVEYYKQSLKN